MKRTGEEKEILKKLGSKIRELRTLKNISQTNLALLMNSEKTNLSRLEAGNTNPTFLTLKKIADVLNIKLVELMVVHTV